MRYGLDRKIYTLDEIGRKLGLTRERVRQIEAHGLRELFTLITGRKFRGAGTRKPEALVKARRRAADEAVAATPRSRASASASAKPRRASGRGKAVKAAGKAPRKSARKTPTGKKAGKKAGKKSGKKAARKKSEGRERV